MKATATRYEFQPEAMFVGAPEDMPEGDPFVISVEWRGGATWVVMRGSSGRVWCESASEWEFEPSPSNRDDDFIARTRYPLAQALAIGERLAAQPSPSTLRRRVERVETVIVESSHHRRRG